MCTRKSVTERLKIMENAGMISEKVAVFCTNAAGMILKEKGDADEEKLNMFITHLAMAADRMEKGNDNEIQISPDILEEVKKEEVYKCACSVQQQILQLTELEFTQTETDFLTVHICNVLMP